MRRRNLLYRQCGITEGRTLIEGMAEFLGYPKPKEVTALSARSRRAYRGTCSSDGLIRLCPYTASVETALHELAHFIAREDSTRYIRWHGKEWKETFALIKLYYRDYRRVAAQKTSNRA